ncbi:hypothetical protein FAI40_00915 [Acetobacteraceae bacterium]|nr:hypothetical protein FAI40_00915 [Acetobacteraceae bacterium]
MLKRSVLSFLLISAIGGSTALMCGTSAFAARILDKSEAEKLTFSALISDSVQVYYAPKKASSFKASKTPKRSFKPAGIHQVAYHPKKLGHSATIKRAVYRKSGSHLLNQLDNLRRG